MRLIGVSSLSGVSRAELLAELAADLQCVFGARDRAAFLAGESIVLLHDADEQNANRTRVIAEGCGAEIELKALKEEDRFTAPASDEVQLSIERPVIPRANVAATPSDEMPSTLGHHEVKAPPEPVFIPIVGRLFEGRLRERPPLRLAIGIVLGLIVGYALQAPLARRAERNIAEIRARADKERYRPIDEAQQATAALDGAADDAASSAAYKSIVIWLGGRGCSATRLATRYLTSAVETGSSSFFFRPTRYTIKIEML